MVVITAAEAAKKLGLSTQTIHKWLKSGKLEGSKVGHLWRINLDEVVALLPGKRLAQGRKIATAKAGSREVSFVGLGGDGLIVTQNNRPVAVIEQSKLNAAIQTVVREIQADTLTIEADAALMLEAVLGAIYGIKVVNLDGERESGAS